MRVDVAEILIAMGYSSGMDFLATQHEPGIVDVVWLSGQPMPSDKEIDSYAAAHPNAYAATLQADARDNAQGRLASESDTVGQIVKAVVVVLTAELQSAVPTYAPPKLDVLVQKVIDQLAVADAAVVDVGIP